MDEQKIAIAKETFKDVLNKQLDEKLSDTPLSSQAREFINVLIDETFAQTQKYGLERTIKSLPVRLMMIGSHIQDEVTGELSAEEKQKRSERNAKIKRIAEEVRDITLQIFQERESEFRLRGPEGMH
ncbi:MAG TPA: hypothetical protein VEA18_01410 [Candidatus Kapabacteria bacterium]|nr:hypothetical protein [Candidatus Kapabacteria bacterium]